MGGERGRSFGWCRWGRDGRGVEDSALGAVVECGRDISDVAGQEGRESAGHHFLWAMAASDIYLLVTKPAHFLCHRMPSSHDLLSAASPGHLHTCCQTFSPNLLSATFPDHLQMATRLLHQISVHKISCPSAYHHADQEQIRIRPNCRKSRKRQRSHTRRGDASAGCRKEARDPPGTAT